MARPGLADLLEAMRAGKVSKVVVWRLDRLGRTAKGLLDLLEECDRLKVGMVFLREGIDVTTPAGRMMYTVLAGCAAYETEVRGERVRAGIAAKKARGEKWGGSATGREVKVHDAERTKVRNLRSKGFP